VKNIQDFILFREKNQPILFIKIIKC